MYMSCQLDKSLLNCRNAMIKKKAYRMLHIKSTHIRAATAMKATTTTNSVTVTCFLLVRIWTKYEWQNNSQLHASSSQHRAIAIHLKMAITFTLFICGLSQFSYAVDRPQASLLCLPQRKNLVHKTRPLIHHNKCNEMKFEKSYGQTKK